MKPRTGRLRIHLGLVLAEIICVPAFGFELYRALGGNTLSWAYVFEWPLLGAYGVYMWKKLLREERLEREPIEQPASGTQSARSTRPLIDDDEGPDPELDAWNAYLARVHGPQGATDDTETTGA